MPATLSHVRATPRLPQWSGVILWLIVFVGALSTAIPAKGAAVIWTGLGGTNNWSDGANWSTGTKPGSGDIAVFDATSTKDATINVAVSIAGIQVSVGYSGTITQSAVTTTVGAAGFSQASGNFIGSSSAITVNGGFTLSGGSFTSTTGTLTVSGSFSHGGGSFDANGGTVKFTGGGAVIGVPGSETFNHLTFAPTTAGSVKTVTAGTNLIVQGTLTLTEGAIDTGSVSVGGDVSQASTFDGGSGLLLVVGAGDQVFSGAATATAGSLPNVEVVKPSGLLSLVGTIRTTRNWTHTAGVVDPGASTVVFAGTELVSVTGMTFSNVTVDGGAPTSGVTLVQGPLIVNGTLTLASGRIATGGSKVVITSTGNVVRSSGLVSGDLQKHVPTGSAVTIAFEIGDPTWYAPVIVSFGTVSLSGDLIARTDMGDHADIANSGVSPTKSVNRWWTLTNSAIGFDYYDLALNFVGSDVDPGSDTSAFIVSKLDGVAWTQPTGLTPAATSIEAGDLTTFSDFVVGEPVVDVGVSIAGSPEPVAVPNTIVYTITVENAGPGQASNVALTDPLPDGVTYQSADSSQGSCTEASATVTCALGDLPPGSTSTVTIRATASIPGTVINTVTVTTDETDLEPINDTASWTSHIETVSDPPLLPPTPIGPPSGTFADVPIVFWAYPSIEALFDAGLTQGCGTTPDGTHLYCPNTLVTRAEMAVFLTRSLRLPSAPPSEFSDVSADAWYGDAVSRLAAASITRGCAPGLFCPDKLVTRGEMALFLTRGLDLPSAPTTEFSDVSADSWYGDAVSRLAAAAITKGCAPDHFCPNSHVSRAEMAVFLTRALHIAPA